MKELRAVLMLWLALVSLTRVMAQPNLVAKTYGPAEGFTSSTVFAITQDAQGFMWFGTGTGLYRFDGYTFVAFHHQENDTLSLSDNFVRCLYSDELGHLWIGTLRGGLCRLDTRTMTMMRFHDQRDSIGKTMIVNAIEGDRKGNVWVATNRGLHRYSSGRWSLKNFSGLVPPKMRPFGLHLARDGTLWMGYPNRSFASYRPESGEFRFYNVNPPNHPVGGLIRNLVEDTNGTIWMSAMEQGLVRFEPKSSKTTFISAPTDASLRSVNQTREGDLLVTGEYGLYLVDKRTASLQKVENPMAGLDKDGVMCTYQSSEGMVWLGTPRKGVMSLHQIRSLTSNPLPFGASLGNIIKAGNIHYYIYPGRGLQIRNTATGKDSIRLVPGMPPSDFLVYDVLTHTSETLWIATSGGVFRMNKAGKWKRFEISGAPRANTELLVDMQDQLWAGGNGIGCYRYDQSSESFVFLEGSGGQITDLESTSEGIWTAKPDNGLRLVVPNSTETTTFMYKEGDSTSISNSYVSRLLKDRSGGLWAGTMNGLNRYNSLTRNFTRIKISDQSNVVTSMDYAADSSFLLKTKDGVYRFDPLSGSRNSSKIQTPLDLSNAYAVLHYPWFTFEKDGFLIECHLDSITPESIPPKMVITSFQLAQNNIHPLSLEEARINPAYLSRIELDYDQNLINLAFAAMDFSSPGKNQYSYQLEGFDVNWTLSGTRNFVTYTNLDPGDYVFKVRGANGYGIWSEQPATLVITIHPPPWKTWWAYTGYGLMFIGLLFIGRRIIVNRERLKAQVTLEQKEKQTMRELDQLKSKFFSNITHEFRTPLTLIQGPAEELLEKTQDSDARKLLVLIKSNSSRLLKLINQLLDLAKMDAREMKLHNTPVDLKTLMNVTVSQFTSLAESRGVAYNWLIGELPVVQADGEKLEAILTNLISNAIKFTSQSGKVEVQANWNDHQFIFVVRDTGRGIPAEKLPHIFDRFYQVSPSDASHSEGTGIGLALVKEYVEIMKGILEVESKVGLGTAFTIKLPLTPGDLPQHAVESKQVLSNGLPAMESVAEEKGQRPLVLLVEDNTELRSFIRTCLGNEYRYSEAGNGRDGMSLAMNQIPDLIISDLMMPEMDGLELCARLKKDKRTDHIPFIMLTAKAAEENKLEGLQTGANEYLVKPFNKAELLLKVQNLITLRTNLQTHIRTAFLAQASTVQATSAEEQFVLKARLYVETHLKDETLSVVTLSQEMNLSREQCYRKLSALTGLAPLAFIRKIKLQRAHQLLSAQWGPVSQVAYEAGFENLSHFSKAFKEEFGKLPSEV